MQTHPTIIKTPADSTQCITSADDRTTTCGGVFQCIPYYKIIYQRNLFGDGSHLPAQSPAHMIDSPRTQHPSYLFRTDSPVCSATAACVRANAICRGEAASIPNVNPCFSAYSDSRTSTVFASSNANIRMYLWSSLSLLFGYRVLPNCLVHIDHSTLVSVCVWIILTSNQMHTTFTHFSARSGRMISSIAPTHRRAHFQISWRAESHTFAPANPIYIQVYANVYWIRLNLFFFRTLSIVVSKRKNVLVARESYYNNSQEKDHREHLRCC